jgi:uncharacterized membrane protein
LPFLLISKTLRPSSKLSNLDLLQNWSKELIFPARRGQKINLPTRPKPSAALLPRHPETLYSKAIVATYRSFCNFLIMADWLDHTVQVEVEAPIERVWGLWSDLEQMPKWMKWIDSVTIQPDNPDLSRWKLASSGFEFSWQSRITKLVQNQIMQWESVDGLPNRGAIRFYDRGDRSVVKLTVSYAIPGILGKVMDNLFLGSIVESTLQADLNRFRDYALQAEPSS